MTDEYFMNVALQLAEGVQGQTTPNPPVGAVIVKNGAIIGVGVHMKSGQAHAEVIALNMAGKAAEGATMYVTLEPCSHRGKTPPCADLIIEHQLKRVVVASVDYNKRVNRKGIKKLMAANIEVDHGVLSERSDALYEIYFHYIEKEIPYITLKTAMTLDGKTATENGDSKWITSKDARNDVHTYRHRHDAILVGVETVLADNPRLTTRLPHGRNPVRIILDNHLRTPLDAHVVTDRKAPTWIFVNKDVPEEKIVMYEAHEQVRIIPSDFQEVQIENVLTYLWNNDMMSVFVEGGATVNGTFLKAGHIDRFICYIAPKIIGGKRARGAISGHGMARITEAYQLDISNVEMLGEDIKVIARKRRDK